MRITQFLFVALVALAATSCSRVSTPRSTSGTIVSDNSNSDKGKSEIEKVHIKIDRFSRDEQSNAVIAEFSDRSKFQGLTLSAKQLSKDNFHYPANGYISSNYGMRNGRMHSGIDIKVGKKEPIYAAFDGVVRVSKKDGAYGRYIVIRHYNGLETLYSHATRNLVRPNQKVRAGEKIALAGQTGRATGVHLHFEVRVAGQPINPNLLLDTSNKKLKDTNLYVTKQGSRIVASNSEIKSAQPTPVSDDDSKKNRKKSKRKSKKSSSNSGYTVRKGDTLYSIARDNNTTVDAICKLSNISAKSPLSIGQKIRLK